MSDEIVLIYVGNGAYVAGVPACNLTADQIAESGYTAAQLLAFRNGPDPLYIQASEDQAPQPEGKE